MILQPASRNLSKSGPMMLSSTVILNYKLRYPGGGGGGGGTPLYKVYRYVPPQRVWFLSRFGLKTGINFDKRSRDRYNVELQFKGYYISAGQTSLLQV